jgi:hypothetical protein
VALAMALSLALLRAAKPIDIQARLMSELAAFPVHLMSESPKLQSATPAPASLIAGEP